MPTHPDLPFEQAINREYLEKLERKLSRNPVREVAQNVIWIDHASHQIMAASYHHPLLGRVGCNDTAPEDLRDFHIGPRHIDDGEVLVYSWAAPIARLFFQPNSEGSDNVVARRTFTHKANDVNDVDEEWVVEGSPSPFVRGELNVPAPVPRASSRRRTRATFSQAAKSSPAKPPPPSLAPPTPSVSRPQKPLSPQTATSSRKAGQRREAVDISAGMRAKEAVLKRLTAPRQDRLMSVLALLQPDQHALTTWPANQHLVVQGHPGTGKTVVAAYRAAFLVNPALYEPGGPLAFRADRPLRVLVIGPTRDYVAHVQGLIDPLAPADQVVVMNITEVLIDLTGMKGNWSGALEGSFDDVDERAAELVRRAQEQLIRSGSSQKVRLPSSVIRGNGTSKRDARGRVKAIYELLRSNGSSARPLTTDQAEIRWLNSLPPFESAAQRRLLPLMAQCGLAAGPLHDSARFDHIVVDEAQDVSPIEWTVLGEFLRPSGRWTLVGDMNQRRSDVTYGAWEQVAKHLNFTDSETSHPQIMSRGYRSTGAILKFADRLLPAAERGNQTVQDHGDPVRGHRVTNASKLASDAVSTAARLARKHAAGSTAIITMAPQELIRELGRKGWRRPGASHQIWTKGSLTLKLHVPGSARGLEFDAVVVVEPGAFPVNLGRKGQLYTSLTRANRELAVVWSRDLPDPLRRGLRT